MIAVAVTAPPALAPPAAMAAPPVVIVAVAITLATPAVAVAVVIVLPGQPQRRDGVERRRPVARHGVDLPPQLVEIAGIAQQAVGRIVGEDAPVAIIDRNQPPIPIGKAVERIAHQERAVRVRAEIVIAITARNRFGIHAIAVPGFPGEALSSLEAEREVGRIGADLVGNVIGKVEPGILVQPGVLRVIAVVAAVGFAIVAVGIGFVVGAPVRPRGAAIVRSAAGHLRGAQRQFV